jgi:hypothetical protein
MSNERLARPYITRADGFRIPLGYSARRQIGNSIIFRVRPGNGYFGSQVGEIYQDQYPYFVPSSINNPQGAASRTAFATAVHNWKNVLTDEEKAVYHKRAVRRGKMSGYNLYIGEYVEANA